MRYLIVLLVLSAFATTTEARPKPLSGEAFDTILGAVDADTAAELSASRASVDSLRAELMALREADADEASIAGARDALRDARGSLRTDLRDIVSNDEDLQATLRDAAQAAREEHRVARQANRDARFDELLSVASSDQAALLQTQQSQIAQLRADLRAAHDAGAGSDVTGDLKAELRTLQRNQRAAVREVVKENRNLLDDVIGPNERRRFRRGCFGG